MINSAKQSIATKIAALFFQRSLDGQQRFFEYREIVFHGVPDDLAVNPLIFVTQDVADAGDVLPADILVLRLEFTAEVAARFRNHLNTSAPAPNARPRNARSRGKSCRRWLSRFLGCSQACRGYEAAETGSPLKNRLTLAFNPFTTNRMQPLPPRHCETTVRATARPMARNDGSGAGGQAHAWLAAALPSAAWAAARRAIGTR